MDVSTYSVEAEVEATHWWFVGRRQLIGRLIKTLMIPKGARILDIGTSTGTNLRMLSDLGYTQIEGLDASAEAVRWCADKGLGKVTQGDICRMPFDAGTFDLVLATDIIEHVDDDALALSEIYRVLRPRAPAIITVPTFEALWGLQDEVAHHKRRYRRPLVLERIRGAGLRCEQEFYFNYLLLLPILIARRLIRVLNIKLRSENELNSPLINRVLSIIFDIDIRSAPLLHPPAGVSFLAVARKQ